MKLADYATYRDYGTDWFLQILTIGRRFALFDIHWQWDEYPATEIFPFLIFSIGPHSLFGFTFRYRWFECRCDILQTRPQNLKRYQTKLYLVNYDE